MLADCSVCQELWQEFAESSKANSRFNSETRLAESQQNRSLLRLLEPKVKLARLWRGETRTALDRHEASHLGADARVA